MKLTAQKWVLGPWLGLAMLSLLFAGCFPTPGQMHDANRAWKGLRSMDRDELGILQYLNNGPHKAIAVDSELNVYTATDRATADEAVASAMKFCEHSGGDDCRIVGVDCDDQPSEVLPYYKPHSPDPDVPEPCRMD